MSPKVAQGLEEMGITPYPGLLDKFQAYLKEIQFWNPKYSLVNAQGEELEVKHLLDSLVAVPFLEKLSPRSVADVGSGGGFPGIPLALYFPEIPFTLIERSGKRVRFLENAVHYLGLSNVRVLPMPVEEVVESWDWITFRALSALNPEFVSTLIKRLRPGGRLVAYKGRMEVIKEEMKALEGKGYQVHFEEVKVAFLEEERHLVFLSEGMGK